MRVTDEQANYVAQHFANYTSGPGFLAAQAAKDLVEVRVALSQASLDIMNLGAFLRLEGKSDLADIAMNMEKAARAALVRPELKEET